MPNYCEFSMTAKGETDVLERFADYFQGLSRSRYPHKTINGMGVEHDHEEVFVDLDPIGEDEVAYLVFDTARRADADRWTRDKDGLFIDGWCKWTPPIGWLEYCTNIIPGLSFSLKCTIEHELSQEWKVADGEATKTYELLYDIQNNRVVREFSLKGGA